MVNINIAKEQKKIIGVFGIVFIAVLILWFFIYLPQKKKFVQIREELKNTEIQISQIMDLAKTEKIEVVAQKLNKEFNSLKMRFNGNEREVINNLSSEAEKFKVAVKSITPREKVQFNADAKSYSCQELPVTMKLAGGFRNLGEYLSSLEDNTGILVSIKKLEINTAGVGAPNLDISVDLSAYILKENK